MFNVYDRPGAPASASLAAQLEPFGASAGYGTLADAAALTPPRLDRVGRSLLDPLQANAAMPSVLNAMPFGSLVQQLLAAFDRLLSTIGSLAGNASVPAEATYANATASSTGDPHLAFDATTAGGKRANARFDSMTSHDDLLHSRSFAGGYRVSTAVTAPGQNGVTYNQSATVTTDFGDTSVTLDKNGSATLVSRGQQLSIAAGQSLDLGNGETVTRNADGSLTVDDLSVRGGSIATTLRSNGQGVDVNVQARDVALGGDLASAAAPDFQRNLL